MVGWAGDGLRWDTLNPMIIALTIIALFIQFVGVYALLIHAQRAQEAKDEITKPANQRGRQVYYDAFADRPVGHSSDF